MFDVIIIVLLLFNLFFIIYNIVKQPKQIVVKLENVIRSSSDNIILEDRQKSNKVDVSKEVPLPDPSIFISKLPRASGFGKTHEQQDK